MFFLSLIDNPLTYSKNDAFFCSWVNFPVLDLNGCPVNTLIDWDSSCAFITGDSFASLIIFCVNKDVWIC